MSTQYNLIADQYDLSFQLAPYRLYVEAYSVLELLGDVSGKSILDLATGTGFYARVVRKASAARVVAVDIAGDMVQIGRMAEENEPLGIEYHTQDIMHFNTDEPFDIGLAVYLLHYAPSKEALAMMCRAIAQNIQSGGRFITYILNPNLARIPNYYQEYGLNINFQSQTPYDGEPVPFSISLGGMTTPEIMAYRWDKETLNSILRDAGFDDIQWVEPTLSSEGVALQGADYYATYMQQPHAVLLTCVKK